MTGGFKLNKQAIAKMTREIQREFDKNPIRVAVQADPPSGIEGLQPAATVNNYSGPVVQVNGDNVQLAWNNGGDVSQTSTQVNEIAEGYEQLATLLTTILSQVAAFGLGGADEQDLRASAEEILGEVTNGEPDQSKVRKGVNVIKGLLAPLALGASQATTAESAELSRHAIESLAHALPF